MQVTTTVPIQVDGKLICEFDVEVDVDITSQGSPPQTYGLPEDCDPGEAPEWVEEGYMILIKVFDKETKEYKDEQVECPEGLKPYVEEHFQSETYIDIVSVAIGEEDTSYDY